MNFRELIESGPMGQTAKDFEKKIKAAKKGECEELDKELSALHKERKISSKEFSELEAQIGRKMRMMSEEVQEINSNAISYIIPKTMAMIAQAHLWHLLVKSGQKHTALNEFYEELQDELDELSERYIAQGGMIDSQQFVLDTDTSVILERVDNYRKEISSCISELTGNSEMASILDGVTDLQECVDSFIYKFKLD